MSTPRTLRDSLGEGWVDVDGAEHDLAIALGLVPPTTEMRHYKGVYWSNNPLGNALHECLMVLTRAGILESREGESEVRWSPAWVPPAPSIPVES